MTLTQMIVNTKGKTLLMTQKRGADGRFTGPATVLRNQGLKDITINTTTMLSAVVVQHGYDQNQQRQTVSVVSRLTGKGAVYQFTNDGSSIGADVKHYFYQKM